MTTFRYYPLAKADKACGVVVVIDVLRAFTTAAHALNAGALKIYPVADVETALSLNQNRSDTLLMGEVNGIRPEGFDFGNSPAEIRKGNLKGKSIIQRTSAGTQGICRAVNADLLVAASFVVATGTVNYLQKFEPDEISFIITGEFQGLNGDEDRACGEYIEALMTGDQPDPEEYTSRVSTSSAGRLFLEGDSRHLLQQDLLMSIQVDNFNFCLPVHREESLLVIKSIFP
jgi:2-phosphosulfolactate phosphatase